VKRRFTLHDAQIVEAANADMLKKSNSVKTTPQKRHIKRLYLDEKEWRSYCWGIMTRKEGGYLNGVVKKMKGSNRVRRE
jgi:hypothetical protein